MNYNNPYYNPYQQYPYTMQPHQPQPQQTNYLPLTFVNGIEGAKALEDLQVKNIRILDKVNGIICYPTIIYYDEDNITSISKQYTNGVTIYQHISEGTNLKTEMYRNSITFSHNTPRIALSTEIKKDGQIHTEADLSDFGFDIDTLPTYEELTSLTPPESLQKSKVYVKR